MILLASIVGYLKRENLYIMLYARYWAVAAMVRVNYCFVSGSVLGVFCCYELSDLDLRNDIGSDVESHSRSSICSPEPTDWRNGNQHSSL